MSLCVGCCEVEERGRRDRIRPGLDLNLSAASRLSHNPGKFSGFEGKEMAEQCMQRQRPREEVWCYAAAIPYRSDCGGRSVGGGEFDNNI